MIVSRDATNIKHTMMGIWWRRLYIDAGNYVDFAFGPETHMMQRNSIALHAVWSMQI